MFLQHNYIPGSVVTPVKQLLTLVLEDNIYNLVKQIRTHKRNICINLGYSPAFTTEIGITSWTASIIELV